MLHAPDYNVLPQTVRSAELRRGTLVRCGPGVRGVGWPETPQLRARALAPLIGNADLVAVLYTAAWVWGADIPCSPRHQFSTLNGARYLRATPPGAQVREFSVREEHTRRISGVRVTDPGRTLYDLLYLHDEEYEEFGLTAARSLLERYGHTQPNLVTCFHGRNRPYRLRAEARFSELFDVIR